MRKILENPELKAWYEQRPPAIKAMIDKAPPSNLYKLKTTGQLVFICSYEESEPGDPSETVCVSVTRDFNLIVMERNVFGINLSDLEIICDRDDCGPYRIKWAPNVRREVEALDLTVSKYILEYNRNCPYLKTKSQRKLEIARYLDFAWALFLQESRFLLNEDEINWLCKNVRMR